MCNAAPGIGSPAERGRVGLDATSAEAVEMTNGDGVKALDLASLLASESLRQLVARYALCVDSRDIDGLVSLFVPDVKTTSGPGRDALRQEFDTHLRQFGRTVHFVMNHIIDLLDGTHASGVVYCRAEHEYKGELIIMALQYTDDYELADARWRFRRRRVRHWYATDVLTRPIGKDINRWKCVGPARLPEAWPTWEQFWQEDNTPQRPE
jgi:hypothetical protein